RGVRRPDRSAGLAGACPGGGGAPTARGGTPASPTAETASCARHPHGRITTRPLRRQTCAVAKRSTWLPTMPLYQLRRIASADVIAAATTRGESRGRRAAATPSAHTTTSTA